MIFSVPAEYFIFSAILLGIAVAHRRALHISLAGLTVLLAFKLLRHDFALVQHLAHEARLLINLLGLLVGFALMARYFEESGLQRRLPALLPNGVLGGISLLGGIFVLSGFLDNIAAAVIGTLLASSVFSKRVHPAFLVAIVAAANAGGAGSVIGDTTTTMLWISGKSALMISYAYVAALAAFAVFAPLASVLQNRYQQLQRPAAESSEIRWPQVLIVCTALVATALANVWFDFPALGLIAALLIAAPFYRPPLAEIPQALKGAVFLLALVLSASLVPVTALPPPTHLSTFGLGILSAVFDNIPLTKLAIDQGGYDWPLLSFAVGYGGSLTWFGSSAGVAVTGLFPEHRSVLSWIRNAWHVLLGYLVGFAALVLWGS